MNALFKDSHASIDIATRFEELYGAGDWYCEGL